MFRLVTLPDRKKCEVPKRKEPGMDSWARVRGAIPQLRSMWWSFVLGQ